jgi:hypothetical protein
VSPVNTAKEHLEQTRVNDNWKVLRTSFPFSMFITGRIFWGFDLDYRTSVYDDILSGVQKVFTPSYLGVVNVYYDHQRPREVNLGETWQEIT